MESLLASSRRRYPPVISRHSPKCEGAVSRQPLICHQLNRGEAAMTGKQSPLWNQDAITAAGLAFAGMSVLQSKLFASMSWAEWPWLRSLTESHLFQWWPLLLIALGVVLWIARAWERRAQKSYRTAALMGGQRGTKVVAAHPQILFIPNRATGARATLLCDSINCSFYGPCHTQWSA